MLERYVRDFLPYTQASTKIGSQEGLLVFATLRGENGADRGSTMGREANGADPAGDRAERHYS